MEIETIADPHDNPGSVVTTVITHNRQESDHIPTEGPVGGAIQRCIDVVSCHSQIWVVCLTGPGIKGERGVNNLFFCKDGQTYI